MTTISLQISGEHFERCSIDDGSKFIIAVGSIGMWRLQPYIIGWINENIHYKFHLYHRAYWPFIEFYDDEDALLFKMRWL